MLCLKENATIVFQGDSITDTGRNLMGMQYDSFGQGYVFNLVGEISTKFARKKYRFYNTGISGNTVFDLYARWQRDTIAYIPDLISILVGVNDVGNDARDVSTVKLKDRFEKAYRLIIEETLDVLPSVKFVLLEPFVLQGNWEMEGRIPYIEIIKNSIPAKQAIVSQLAGEYKCIYVPLQERFNEAARITASSEYWLQDGVHPTCAGHRLIADAWLEEVSPHISF